MELRYDKHDLQQALKVLREGGVILYPTDTIWGIGCDATCAQAVARVYEIKKRVDSKAMLVLLDGAGKLQGYMQQVPETAWMLLEANEGQRPMTIIYPGAVVAEKGSKQSNHCLAHNTVAEDCTVGIRVPMMEFCQQLVSRLGRPIVSTSANISGAETPKRFAEISEAIKSAVDYVVDPSLEKGSTGKSSSIIKVGLDYSIEIIRK